MLCPLLTFSFRWWRYLQDQVNNPRLQNQLNNILPERCYLQAQVQMLNQLKRREKPNGQYSLTVKSYCPLPSKKIFGNAPTVTTGQTGSDNTWKLTWPRFQIGQPRTASAMKCLPQKEGGWSRKGPLIPKDKELILRGRKPSSKQIEKEHLILKGKELILRGRRS